MDQFLANRNNPHQTTTCRYIILVCCCHVSVASCRGVCELSVLSNACVHISDMISGAFRHPSSQVLDFVDAELLTGSQQQVLAMVHLIRFMWVQHEQHVGIYSRCLLSVGLLLFAECALACHRSTYTGAGQDRLDAR